MSRPHFLYRPEDKRPLYNAVYQYEPGHINFVLVNYTPPEQLTSIETTPFDELACAVQFDLSPEEYWQLLGET